MMMKISSAQSHLINSKPLAIPSLQTVHASVSFVSTYDHLSFSSLSFLLTLMKATISKNTTARTATCSVVEEISEEVSSLSSLLSGFVVPPLLLPVLPVLPDAPTSTVNSMVEVLELPDASALTTDNV